KEVDGQRLTYLLRPQPTQASTLDTPPPTDASQVDTESDFLSDIHTSDVDSDFVSDMEHDEHAARLSTVSEAPSSPMAWSVIGETDLELDEGFAASVESLSLDADSSDKERTPRAAGIRGSGGVYMRNARTRFSAWNEPRSGSSPSRSPARRPLLMRREMKKTKKAEKGTFYDYLFAGGPATVDTRFQSWRLAEPESVVCSRDARFLLIEPSQSLPLVYMAVQNIRRPTVSTPKQVSLTNDVQQAKQNDQVHVYRLYRRRFAGLLGFILFGLVTGMPWAWFGPISNDTSEDFAISVTDVNWLGNITSCIYLPVCLLVPVFSNPIGGAVGQLLSPLVGSSRQSILVLGIISTAVTPALFLIDNEPPTPPTYAGSKAPQSLGSLVRAMAGKTSPGEDSYMSPRERLDFTIISTLFGVMAGATNALSILSAQYFEPQGYSDTMSGLFGATLLLSGILACVVTAPLFDRVLTHHLGITLKTLVPIVAGAWLSLIWAVKPNNTGGLFAIMIIIGTCSVTMLPVGLELGVELTRNADGSSAIMWCAGNAFGIVFILAEDALRASATASPPYNMRSALVLHGVFVAVFSVLILFVRAKQARREMDERMAHNPYLIPGAHVDVDAVPMEKMGSSTSDESTGSVETEGQESIPLYEKGVRVEVVGTITHPEL
ncbi:MFS general substrate transporter, partial [Rhizopogon salebrosus TDB-379]